MKRDRVENTVMDGPRIGSVGKVRQIERPENVATGGVKIDELGKVGNSENSKN